MEKLTDHQSECLEKIKSEFGEKEFTSDDINPITFQRPDFVLNTLAEKGYLKRRSVGPITSLKSVYCLT